MTWNTIKAVRRVRASEQVVLMINDAKEHALTATPEDGFLVTLADSTVFLSDRAIREARACAHRAECAKAREHRRKSAGVQKIRRKR